MGNGHLKTVVAVGLIILGALLIVNTAWLIHSDDILAKNVDKISTVLMLIVGGLLVLAGVISFGSTIEIKKKKGGEDESDI